jgi:hypothetical protein
MPKLPIATLPVLAVLLALPELAHAQEPATSNEAVVTTTAAEPAPRRLLLKAGIAPSRLIPQHRWYVDGWDIAPSLGAEYQLGPHVSLYGQAEVDFLIGQRRYYGLGNSGKDPLVHTGAVGVGLRRYYNQEGRERRNRAHGPFVGNYYALEATTELNRRKIYRYDSQGVPLGIEDTEHRIQVTPLLTAYWGMQRRLGQHFLYDANIGLGLLAEPYIYSFYSYGRNFDTLYRLESTVALNLRLYFVH